MNAVIGFTSLLLEEPLSPDQKDYIEGIRNGGEALLAVINNVLDFSRADKEKVELEHQPFSLRHCIESSLDMVAPQANQKCLNFLIPSDTACPTPLSEITAGSGRYWSICLTMPLSSRMKAMSPYLFFPNTY